MCGGEGAREENEGGGVMKCVWRKEYIPRGTRGKGVMERTNICGGNSGHMRQRRGGEGKCFGQSECM